MFMWKPALVGTVAVVLFGTGLYFLLRSAEIAGYRPVEAGLLHAEVERSIAIRYSRRSRISSVREYAPSLAYTYKVDGVEYRGSRFRLPSEAVSHSESLIRNHLVRKGLLKPGEVRFVSSPSRPPRRITIYVNSRDPRDSAVVLDFGDCAGYQWYFLLSSLFLGALALLAFFIERGRLEEHEQRQRRKLLSQLHEND